MKVAVCLIIYDLLVDTRPLRLNMWLFIFTKEEEEYGYPSLVFRTFDEEEYESPEESSEEED